MAKLFIGGLAWHTEEETLLEQFKKFGEVKEAVVVKDRDTGRSRGFGFVRYHNDYDAQKAIDEMNNTKFDGRIIRVDYASDRRDAFRGMPGYGMGGYGGGPGFNPMAAQYGGPVGPGYQQPAPPNMYGGQMYGRGYQPQPQYGMPQPGMPQQDMPPQGMPPQGMPPQGMPPQGMPPQGMPQQGYPMVVPPIQGGQSYMGSYSDQPVQQGPPSSHGTPQPHDPSQAPPQQPQQPQQQQQQQP